MKTKIDRLFCGAGGGRGNFGKMSQEKSEGFCRFLLASSSFTSIAIRTKGTVLICDILIRILLLCPLRTSSSVLGCAGFHGDCLTLTKLITARLQVHTKSSTERYILISSYDTTCRISVLVVCVWFISVPMTSAQVKQKSFSGLL